MTSTLLRHGAKRKAAAKRLRPRLLRVDVAEDFDSVRRSYWREARPDDVVPLQRRSPDWPPTYLQLLARRFGP
jgi:hypothetical protein